MTLPQVFSLFVGGGVCLASLWGFVSSKTRHFRALIWLGVGLTMLYAGFRPSMIEWVGPDSTDLRLRLVVALLSFIVITVTLEAIRVSRMLERYAFLWLLTGAVLFVGAIWADMAVVVSRLTGMSYTASVMVVIFSFFIFVLFHLCVALSSQQDRHARLVRELALVEERLRRVEARERAGYRGLPPADHHETPGAGCGKEPSV